MKNQLPTNDYCFETKSNDADTACEYSNSFTPEQFAEIRSNINKIASEFRHLLIQNFPEKKIGYSRTHHSYGYLADDGWHEIPQSEIVGLLRRVITNILDGNESSKSESPGEEGSDEKI